MREPDTSGWAFWTSQVGPNGRENVRRAFEESPEFAGIIAGERPAGAVGALLAGRKADVVLSNGMVFRSARLAIEALGRIGDKTAVPVLLEASDPLARDRSLEHALIYALIEIADPASTAAGWRCTTGSTRAYRRPASAIRPTS